MTRRGCIGLLAAAPLALGAAAEPAEAGGWEVWKAAFLDPSGRVVDTLQGGVSHSEGQGYGMVLATAHDDRAAFEALRAWTEEHLAVRQDPLLAWRWRPGETSQARDYNNASDGDLFTAWALLRAARRWREEAYLARAGEIARALAEICLVNDPRGGERPLLLPGAERFRVEGGAVVNLSYVMPLALHDLAAAFQLPRLAACAEHGAALMWEAAEAGPVPDWTLVTANGCLPSPMHRPVSGYEAIRVPLWLVWSARPGHPAVSRVAAWAREPAVPIVTALQDGSVLERSDAPGYAAVATLAASAGGLSGSSFPAYQSGQPYYPATLHLLAEIALGTQSEAVQ